MGSVVVQNPQSISGESAVAGSRNHYLDRFKAVRAYSEAICDKLVNEDFVVQSMPDVSPLKWHLAHTSWFFETFLLKPHAPQYEEFDPHFAYLFNSYYVTVGDRHCRQNRGLLSRPTVENVYRYRGHVDRAMRRLISDSDSAVFDRVAPVLEIGLNHEQQHQELMLTDIKHVFWVNPLRPAYTDRKPDAECAAAAGMKWIRFNAGNRKIGHDGDGFAFDNELPRHTVYVNAFELGSRLVTNGEYKRFIADHGYERPKLWLSLGWATRQQEQWTAPLYWLKSPDADQWIHHTLFGLRDVADDEPVCHVSFFEADAFARWANARLATEAEWEIAAVETERPDTPNFAESLSCRPLPATDQPGLQQMLGHVWEWTASAYLAYPGYRPPPGALGEYNGKFMCNQFVLRGGSCVTPASHMRPTYRNFFTPDARWQFTGIRLARDV